MITLQEALNEDVCYIATTVVNDKTYYSIHDCNGMTITAFDNRDLAFATALQHDLVPMSIH